MKQEKSSAQAVTNLLALLSSQEKSDLLKLKMAFISEVFPKLITALTIFDGTHFPTAFDIMEDMEVLLAFWN